MLIATSSDDAAPPTVKSLGKVTPKQETWLRDVYWHEYQLHGVPPFRGRSIFEEWARLPPVHYA